MNIFVLDENPYHAAQMLCDKHAAGKMVVESAQMLSTAHRVLDGKLVIQNRNGRNMKHYDLFEGNDDLEAEQMYYRATHINHPCNVWVRESDANYEWLWEHFYALCDEYTYRYGRTHKSSNLLYPLRSKPINIPIGKLTPFALGMKSTNPECMNEDDPVGSYRAFYQTKQDKFKMVWTKRQKPEWFKVK